MDYQSIQNQKGIQPTLNIDPSLLNDNSDITNTAKTISNNILNPKYSVKPVLSNDEIGKSQSNGEKQPPIIDLSKLGVKGEEQPQMDSSLHAVVHNKQSFNGWDVFNGALAATSFLGNTFNDIKNRKDELNQYQQAEMQPIMNNHNKYGTNDVPVFTKNGGDIYGKGGTNPEFENYKNWVKERETKGVEPNDGIFKPYKSLEGGNDTIGYGHKLTDDEIKQGIYNKGISKKEAEDLLNKDIMLHYNSAADKYGSDKFHQLPLKQQWLLTDYDYSGTSNTHPKFMDAIHKYNDTPHIPFVNDSENPMKKYFSEIIGNEYGRNLKKGNKYLPLLDRNTSTINDYIKPSFNVKDEFIDPTSINQMQNGGELKEGDELDLSKEEIEELKKKGYDFDILKEE